MSTVNREVKGMLAKCLATENLIIEYRNVPTASFDVERRILVLPNWGKASDTVFTMLTQHESAHAIFSPAGDDFDYREEYPEVPHDIINVLEDVRVERLFKKKYPGSARHFYNGYQELNDDDFFSTKDENLNGLSFIDRINLYFKIGAFHNIAFSDEENEFVTRISKTETFDEVLKLAQELVDFVKYKRKEITEVPNTSDQMSSGAGGGEEVETPQQQQQGEETEDTSDEGQNQKSEYDSATEAPISGQDNDQPSDTHNEDELKSKTSQSFEEKAQQLNNKYAQETHYVELPELYLDNLVIPNDYIHRKAKEEYNQNEHNLEFFDFACKEYQKYKKSAEKEVSYLVKEFECKKSADQYARSSTARTGVLDTSKLHTYKFNEDLFKKVSVIPDGKNHGLIFILDWSGSMSNWLLDTYKQLLNLIWFCRKVNIPFEVYAFTLDAHSYVELQPNHPPVYNKVKDVIALETGFHLMNFFTSKVSNRELEQQLQNIWSCCYAYQNRRGFVPRHLDLSGSPIGESIIALHALIPAFQQKTKVQKVNVVFLTDGEGYTNATTTERSDYSGGTYVGFTKKNSTSIRNRKSGRIYRSYGYDNFPQYAKILLETVKDRFPTVNLINFRITPTREFGQCYRWYGGDPHKSDEAKALFKKNQCVSFTNTGFHQFNVIAATSLAQEETFEVAEDATKAQIKTAFSKMLGKKKTNKKLLSEFVSHIA